MGREGELSMRTLGAVKKEQVGAEERVTPRENLSGQAPYPKRFRVAHIITHLDLGGAQRNTLFTVENHDRDRFEVILIANGWGILEKDVESYEDVEVCYLPDLKREISPFHDLRAVRKLSKMLNDLRVDIVHTHSSKAGVAGRLAARRARVPVVVHTVHGWAFHPFQSRLKNFIYRIPERKCAVVTDRIITVSDSDREKGLSAGIGRLEQYVTIRSGIDCKHFSNTATRYLDGTTRREFGIARDDFVVGQITRFRSGKNNMAFVEVARRVLERVKNARFLLVGDGIERTEIETKIRKQGLAERFILTGWRRDVEKLIPMCDVITLTTLHEGLPQVCAQAMCCKKPMVMHAVDGIPEALIDGENGYLVEPGDVEGFAEKLVRLANDPGERERMGERGLSMVYPEWDADHMVRRIEALYHEVLVEKGLVADS